MSDAGAAKPLGVARAVMLLWASLAVSIVNVLINPGVREQPASLVVAAIIFALVALLVVKIAAGRNWARIVLLIIVVIGTPLALIGLSDAFAQSLLGGLLSIVVTVLQIYATVLLFTEPGKSWFAKAAA